ncbi:MULTISPECIES: cytochrome d ubiquinol oxidase subunit II [Streptomyces]|uniref:Uncharacterized protein n=1 Tax=Streptomyces venezuelae TaxID=54571 RepID=A0A5P2B6H1_STRVZ|nr:MULTISPECIES: cytochrome d ubiquinol oxidase subunit II [Streptomyces]NEA02392.1 cytochrome d ubiquinol oxidase subunit II [Streptomyces sp. SID10116]MYY82517.1 hypothetical protein [Streptomyces sp. SID335]MYZ16833.1 hypothetical protein [Streptomyces sp. SID337]NDZ85462.1 cytochrome d ubiquinol oxidase subunit II [Streptomyces sp. SID10115]NEB48812.1 cytochrome d ubiquinol oxidase subunit II [Streptomyces sp. SID339]
MAAESFSAAGETSGTGEPLVSTSVHWGTAQLGVPTRVDPAPWQHPAGHTTDQAVPARERAADVAEGVPPERARPVDATEDRPRDPAAPEAEDDAVDELIRVAVVSRPLDDVVDLVTLLEQSPDGMPTAASVLRLAAVARSVDDVTRLVELLGPPKHPADHMDEAIRHAAEERPIPEVSRLVHILSRPPHDPHSGAEVVHAAGTTRSVEDLMQLIGSLREQKETGGAPGAAGAPAADSAAGGTPGTSAPQGIAGTDAGNTTATPSAPNASDAPAAQVRTRTSLVWLRRVAGVLLLLCAAAHFPLTWSGAPTVGLAVALGVSVICAVTGAALCLSGSPFVAVAGTLVAGALTVAHLVDDRLDSKALAFVLRPERVTAPLPTLSAAIATLASLLVVALTIAALRAAAGRDRT